MIFSGISAVNQEGPFFALISLAHSPLRLCAQMMILSKFLMTSHCCVIDSNVGSSNVHDLLLLFRIAQILCDNLNNSSCLSSPKWSMNKNDFMLNMSQGVVHILLGLSEVCNVV